MKLTNKEHFVVFNKTRDSGPKYNVNFFYIKDLKKSKKSFSYINDPFFKGVVIFGLDFKEKVRPLKFDKIQKDGGLMPLDPKLMRQFILADENQFVVFSQLAKQKETQLILKMLNAFQFDKNKVLYLTLCEECLINQKFTLLDKKEQIKYKHRIICAECGKVELFKHIEKLGMLNDRIDPKLKNFFSHLILKFKSVDKVISSFKNDFNPINNKALTLYDVERSQKISKKYENVRIEDLDIPSKLKERYLKLKIKKLLPVQAISIDKGLLSENSDQLIMSPTSSGKTLIGEISGVSKLLANKASKMLYLVPIVALANIRTDEFLKKYNTLGLKIVKKVGESLFESVESTDIKELEEAQIIIATYEAIDSLLRSGHMKTFALTETIVIDEIQTLADEERGFILDGLISRLKIVSLRAQFIYLSATIGEPEILAQKLKSKLIRYSNRPVPIERHLILCVNEDFKRNSIYKIVKNAFSQKSDYGFKGQSIIFTNSRKKCENLSNFFQRKGILVKPYHSGLNYDERKQIETEFQNQKIVGVVATAALAAGVDLPAKQVIFESLSMGIKILSVAEFEQMLGRAGRLGKHKIGLAYLLIEPGKVYNPKSKETEDNVAIRLLNGEIKDFELEPNEDKAKTELLAFISIFNDEIMTTNIQRFNDQLINGNYDLDLFIKELIKFKLIQKIISDTYQITFLGRAIAKSFLTISHALTIIEELKHRDKKLEDIALELQPFKNVYLSKKVVADLSRNVNMKYFSNNFFSASVLSLMNAEYVKKRKKFSEKLVNLIYKWTGDIFNCACDDSPYCDCGRQNFEKIILNLRVEKNLDINGICEFIREEYELLIFKGDLVDYLENLIYAFESIGNIIEGDKTLQDAYITELKKIPTIVDKIKIG